ncbi:MAG TPA: response regulator transcription factor [Candidatus Limnocylindria bacterium]|jgi:DNA-binding NarL/FixJ family response regulator|nr:response regulator transcription factor [Candidatus Limnocylindria bacterium]HTL69470.1 response regulator transcription factor [Lacunisphaera sp.]
MSASRKKIFVVDDHTLVREWLASLLNQHNEFEVCGQADAAPMALAGIIATAPDVALIDLSLKGGSGLDLIKDVRRQCPATQVVVLSMHEEIYFVERAFRAGARGYVTKRESTHLIVTAIRTVLAGQVYANPETLAQLAERMIGHPAERKNAGIELLSDRELEVFRRLGLGHGTRKIATEMNLSMKTVQAYSARIKEKLGLTNVSELMREAVRWVETERQA